MKKIMVDNEERASESAGYSQKSATDRLARTPREEKAIRRLLRGLDRRHPVRRAAERALRGEPVPSDAIPPLFRALAKPSGLHWHEQELATWTLGSLTLTATQRRVAAESLLPILEPKWGLDLGERLKIATGRLLLLSLPVTLWVYTLDNGGRSNVYNPLAVLFYSLVCCALLTPLVLPVSALIEDNRRNRVRARAITALGRLRVPHGLDGIANALYETYGMRSSVGSKRVRAAALTALPAVLATLTPEHYGRLASATVPNLCEALVSPDEPLVLAVLDALQLIGDGRAIKPVERLIVNSRSERVRETARHLLPLLAERHSQENNSRLLLRATTAPDTPAGMLLRPAQAYSESDPAMLLRSSASEGNG